MAAGYRKNGDRQVYDHNIHDSKGDKFTRGETPKPRVYKTGRRMDGSSFIRRIRTTEVPSLEISTLVQNTREFLEREGKPEQLELMMQRPWYWDVAGHSLQDTPNNATQRMRVSVTRPQFGGVRFWWVCVQCKKRCNPIYGVVVGEKVALVGCHKCLGLTYPSQARHGTPSHDRALLTFKTGLNTGVTGEARTRAAQRHHRRELRLIWQIDRDWGTRFSLGEEANRQNEAVKIAAMKKVVNGGGGVYKARDYAPSWEEVAQTHGLDDQDTRPKAKPKTSKNKP